MGETIPFSAALRHRTMSGHSSSEAAAFMDELMQGRLGKEDYIALLGQHYFIYQALEAEAERLRDDPVAGPFIHDALTRLPALEADLEFLVGTDWRERISPLPATWRYVARIHEVGAGWPAGFVAHHYTRYLGDLSGGQFIGKLMAKQFGFDTNGVLFYIFDQIADPGAFKERYREQLDALGWSEQEQERVIDEVLAAYEFNTRVFEELHEEHRARAASA